MDSLPIMSPCSKTAALDYCLPFSRMKMADFAIGRAGRNPFGPPGAEERQRQLWRRAGAASASAAADTGVGVRVFYLLPEES